MSTPRQDDGAPVAPVELEIRSVAKSYDGVDALVDASLELRKGECVTLLGPSGSGKTTLLNVVAGLIAPDRGQVWVAGRDVTWLPPHRRDIGMVFQNYALFPHLDVFENVAFALRMRRRPTAEIRSRVERALAAVALSDKARRMPAQLSGGQQQRIALARAMVYEPSVVLMDEPLAALDKKLREQLQMEIRRFQREFGITMLYVTHDQQEALLLSDRICLMNHARIEQVGTPDDLYHRPRSLFVADFVGESNVLEATVRWREDGQLVMEGPDGVCLRAVCTLPFAAGTPVAVVVRPERLRLRAAGAGDLSGPHNSLRARVREVAFLGDAARYYVHTPGSLVLTSKRLDAGDAEGLQVGDEVVAQFDAASAVVLSREGPLPDTGARA